MLKPHLLGLTNRVGVCLILTFTVKTGHEHGLTRPVDRSTHIVSNLAPYAYRARPHPGLESCRSSSRTHANLCVGYIIRCAGLHARLMMIFISDLFLVSLLFVLVSYRYLYWIYSWFCQSLYWSHADLRVGSQIFSSFSGSIPYSFPNSFMFLVHSWFMVPQTPSLLLSWFNNHHTLFAWTLDPHQSSNHYHHRINHKFIFKFKLVFH